MGSVVPETINAEQWLRAQRQKYILIAFSMTIIAFSSVVGFSIEVGSYGNAARLRHQTIAQDAPKIPPGRLLRVSPFSVRLEDCATSVCDVEIFLRGYDAQGRLRYDNKATFARFTTGQFRDTLLDSTEVMYFEPGQNLSFQMFCRLGSSSTHRRPTRHRLEA